MSTKIGSLFGDVTLRTAGMDKSIASIGKKMDKMGKQFTDLGKSLSLRLTAPIVAFGGLSVKAFAEQEKAEAALRAALQASGQEVDSNFGKLAKMASEIQKVTTVGDEMSLSMMQQGISMGLQSEQIDEATRGAIGLSKAFNLDLKMAMRASSAALLGQTEMLTRYIPELKNIEDPAERVALVHAKMAEGFSLAEAEAQTTGGQLAQLKNTFGDLQEQIGAILAEYLTPFVEKLRDLVTRAQEADPAMLKLGVQIAAVAAALGPLLIAMGLLTTALASSTTWIIALSAGLAIVLDRMGILQEAGEALGQLLYDIWTGDVLGAIGSFVALIGEVIELFTGPFGLRFAADRVRSEVVAVFQTIGRAIDSALSKLRALWDMLVKVTNALPGTGSAGRFIGDQISKIAFRAEGGPVTSGSPYIVGEQGPELFVPRASGQIIPNGASMGGGGQTINMHFAPGIGMDVVAAIKNSRHLIARMAVEAVQESNLRKV